MLKTGDLKSPLELLLGRATELERARRDHKKVEIHLHLQKPVKDQIA